MTDPVLLVVVIFLTVAGIAGLVIGTAAANIVMFYLQFRRLKIGFNGRLEGGKTLMIAARIIVVSVFTGAVARVVWMLVNDVVGTSTIGPVPLGQILSVGAAVAAGGGFYVWAVSHMRVPEWEQIESMIRGRLGV